jgi:hypothetical protein
MSADPRRVSAFLVCAPSQEKERWPKLSPATNLLTVHVPIDDLKPNPANPRKISDQELGRPI